MKAPALPLFLVPFALGAGYVLGCAHNKKPVEPCASPFVFDKAHIDSPFEGLDPSFMRHNYEFEVQRVNAPGCSKAHWVGGDMDPEPYRAWLVTFSDPTGRTLTYALKQTRPAPVEPKTDRPQLDWRP